MYFCVLPNGPKYEDFNINFCGHFRSKKLFLTPWVPIYRVPPNPYAIDIENIASEFDPNVFFVTLSILMAKTRRILA